MEIPLEINTILLKKNYILWKIAPFNLSGTLQVLETGSESGPGNAKFLKTGSGSGTPLPGTRVIHYPLRHYWHTEIIKDQKNVKLMKLYCIPWNFDDKSWFASFLNEWNEWKNMRSKYFPIKISVPHIIIFIWA